jgi:hypothetical protein
LVFADMIAWLDGQSLDGARHPVGCLASSATIPIGASRRSDDRTEARDGEESWEA